MKILLTDIHHGNGGGHATYLLNILHGLRDKCDLTLAAPATGRLFKLASEVEGVRVLPGLYTSRPFTLIKEVKQLRAFLKRERFDIVHANGSADHRHVMLACLGWTERPAIVWTKHNTNGLDSVGNKLRARFGTDLAIAVSDYVAGQLQDSSYSRSLVKTVRHGIDLTRFTSVSKEEALTYKRRWFGSLPQDTVVLGSVGGTDYAKGWLLLAEALSLLEPDLRRRFRVLVAGDPPSETLLGKLKEFGVQDQVVFPGLVKDIRPVLGACDVGFVLSFAESASYAIYESMGMGLPGLVSDAGGLPESIRPGLDGWIVPVGDVSAIVQCLREIHRDGKEVLAQKGASARRRAEQLFAMPSFLERTERVYRTIVERRASGYSVPADVLTPSPDS